MKYFFDLDGTLLDHGAAQEGGLAAIGEFSSELRKCMEDGFLETWRASEEKHFLRFEKGEISIVEQRLWLNRDERPRPAASFAYREIRSLSELVA